MTVSPGDLLGRYEILEHLGDGGMGVVYCARDLVLDRRVAIKLLPADMATDALARERLRREAVAVAALDHPYICKLFEIAEHGDALFLVMEYVNGETLDRRFKNGRLPLTETLRIAGEVAEALQEAEAAGIIHRDLKPANIMLTQQGHVKVMDFGLAKRIDERAPNDVATIAVGSAQLTTHGSIMGTPDYMSPEQAKGLPLDVRSDLFSFGVVVAEMVGGLNPFHRPSTAETLAAVIRDPPQLGPDVPLALVPLLQRLMAKEASARPVSFADVRRDLARVSGETASGSRAVAGAAGAAFWRRPLWAIMAVVLALVAAYGAWRYKPASGGSAADAAAAAPQLFRSIAVLPLDNYSGDPSQDYFAEGMTDELTADLAMIGQLRVISRGSAMQFQGSRRPPTPEVAKVLNVEAIVEGSVVRSGDTVKITAQLIDARADRLIWAKSFQRSSRDVLALQNELASAIAAEIHVQLTPKEQSRLSSSVIVDPVAYDAYLRGRYFFNRPSDQNLLSAIARFEEAVKLSPDFAPAYSGLSDAYLWAGYNEGVMTAAEARPKAKAAAESAIQLDEESAEAHTSLATYKVFYGYDWEGSEREFRRAIALNPNYAFAHDMFGLALGFQGRLDEGLAEGTRAAQLDPLSPQIPINISNTLGFKGDYAAARLLVQRAEELDPTFFFPHLMYGWLDIEAGKSGAAIPALKKAQGLGAPAFVTAWLAYAYGASGNGAAARAELVNLRKVSLRGVAASFNLALVHLGLGEHSRALDHLEQAYTTDSQWLAWLKKDRVFDPLRSQPRFVALMKKLRFTS